MPEPRMDLVNHIRELIERDPEGYASNPKKLEAVADRLLDELTREDIEE